MFEKDVEYLKKEEERYKRLGLKIDNKDTILNHRNTNLKLLYYVSIITSIIYSLFIGFVLGMG